jgi:hypothetical protein
LDALIRNYVPEGSDDVEWMLWIDAWGEALRNPELRTISQRLDAESLAQIERVLRIGVESGEFTCADVPGAAMRLTGLIDGLAVQFAAHDGMMDRGDLIEHVQSLAAWEVGIDRSAFDEVAAREASSVGPPSPATDAALRQLVARYCDGVNRGDTAVFAGTWADDATWDLGDGKPVAGLEAIVAEWTTRMAKFAWVLQSAPQTVFEVDERGGTGTGRVMVQERFKRRTGRVGSLLGTYHDVYIRRGREWAFADRRLEVVEST